MTPLSPKGLTVFAILLLHPTESFLTPFHQERAAALKLKYVRASLVNLKDGVAVKTLLVSLNGERRVTHWRDVTMEPDMFLNILSASIDARYDQVFNDGSDTKGGITQPQLSQQA